MQAAHFSHAIKGAAPLFGKSGVRFYLNATTQEPVMLALAMMGTPGSALHGAEDGLAWALKARAQHRMLRNARRYCLWAEEHDRDHVRQWIKRVRNARVGLLRAAQAVVS